MPFSKSNFETILMFFQTIRLHAVDCLITVIFLKRDKIAFSPQQDLIFFVDVIRLVIPSLSLSPAIPISSFRGRFACEMVEVIHRY